MYRKITAFIAALAIAASGAVSCSSKKSGGDSSSSAADKKTKISGEAAPEIVPDATFPDYPISYPEIEKKTTGDLYEAEKAQLGKGLKVANEGKKSDDEQNEAEAPQPAQPEDQETTTLDPNRNPFSGEGYVTGFKDDGSSGVKFTVDAPSNQHYDLSFSIASKKIVDCRIVVNGKEISSFKTMDDDEFTLITLYGVFLTKGKSEVEIFPKGDMRLDYLKMSNNTSLGRIAYTPNENPANEDTGDSAKALLSFLTENFGKYVITGQYASDDSNKELDLIYQTTGKYPVIRFAAMHNSGDSFDSTFKDIDACTEWHRKGGIVGLMWYWEAPGKKPSVYAKDTDFDLSKAVTDVKLAEMKQEEIRELYAKGKISQECYGIMYDIDNMAGQLLQLKNKGIPVLWRPLHEGYGDWFWWGASGTDDYKWLWQLMYDRFTKYFELDNLIWIWNGQSKSTMVSQNTFDIAALDIYMDKDKEYGSRYEQFLAMQNIVGKRKLIALSECSTIPDIDACFRDNSVWSFYGLWYGKYLMDKDGSFSGEYTSKDALIRAYNSDGALTLDEYRTMRGYDKDEQSSTEAATTDTASTSTTTAADTAASAEADNGSETETTAVPENNDTEAPQE